MPFFVCGTLSLLLLLEQALRPSRALRVLTLLMFAATLLYLGHSVFFCHETALIPLTDTLYNTCNPLVFPLYYIYVEQLTSLRVSLWRVVLLVCPALLCGMAVGVVYLLMSPLEIARFIDGFLYHAVASGEGLYRLQAVLHLCVKVLFGLEIIPILILGFRRINGYDRLLEQNYSSPDSLRLTWVKLMLVIFTGTSVISLVSGLIGRQHFADDTSMLAIPSVLYSLLLFAIAFIGLKQKGLEELMAEEAKNQAPLPSAYKEPTAAEPTATEEAATEPAASPAKSPATPMTLRERIEKVMVSEQLFLNPELKLVDLVKLLNTNRNYVYKAMNVDMKMSFSEYVNRLRVDYAEQLIASHPELTLQEVAIRSGFASTPSFYRNFKAFKGHSPKDKDLETNSFCARVRAHTQHPFSRI